MPLGGFERSSSLSKIGFGRKPLQDVTDFSARTANHVPVRQNNGYNSMEIRSNAPLTCFENGAEAYELFKDYEVTSVLLVRQEEDLGSPVVGEIPAGTMVTVLESGCGRSGRRLKVTDSSGCIRGWITCVSAKGDNVLRKKRKRYWRWQQFSEE